VRYTPDGVIDPTFADAGIAEIPSAPQAIDMLLQRDGKIVVVLGYNFVESSNRSTLPANLFRLNSDGTPDTSFGPDGLFPVDGTNHGDAQAVPQGDKILLLANDTGVPPNDASPFFHVVRIEDAASSAPDDTPIPPAPTSKPLPHWSETPIFQDATDDLDWSQLKQPWD